MTGKARKTSQMAAKAHPHFSQGLSGSGVGGHVRARLRRTPHSATSAKITVHASTLATGSHSGSRPRHREVARR